jgi:ubiquinol-cytochrome c reductase cytochrome c1 subunit
MKTFKNIAVALVAVVGITGTIMASAAGKHPETQAWSFEGMTGKYDMPAVQRGWQVYKEVCSACHSLKYFHFRNLAEMGYDEDMIKAFAKEYEVAGEPDEYGDETVRPALPQDVFPAPFANENAARASNGGALPPDLSLIIKARHDGSNYLFSLMTGYSDAPADHDIAEGKSYNPYFKGGQIGMAPPLGEDILEYEDGTPATQEQMARDVVQFLTFVADPKMEARKHMGLNVLLFLLAMTIIFYLSMKKIWKPVKEGKNFYEDK